MGYNPYWRIWYKLTPEGNDKPSLGVCVQWYIRKGNAIRAAQKRFGSGFDGLAVEWVIAKENPWKQMQEGQ